MKDEAMNESSSDDVFGDSTSEGGGVFSDHRSIYSDNLLLPLTLFSVKRTLFGVGSLNNGSKILN